MNFNIFTIPPFDKQLKRLVKKYPSLKIEYSELLISLKKEPHQGTSLGNDCYKIRLSIASKGKGESGGARVITNVQIKGKSVFLLSIYDKSEQEDIPDKYLKDLLKYLP